MPKKEFWKQFSDDVDKMSIEDLRSYTKKLNKFCQRYFSNWQKAEDKIEVLQAENFKLK